MKSSSPSSPCPTTAKNLEKEADVVIITTKDEVSLKVDKAFAMQIEMIKGSLQDVNEFKLNNVCSKDLETIIKLDKEFQANEKIDMREFTNVQLRQLVAAVYSLGAGFVKIKDSVCQTIADRMRDWSVDYICTFFGVEKGGYTTDEEEKIRKEYAWAFDEDEDEDEDEEDDDDDGDEDDEEEGGGGGKRRRLID